MRDPRCARRRFSRSPTQSRLSMTIATAMRARALQALRSRRFGDHRLDFLALALRGKKVSFEKVLGMIDAMVALLGKEQVADDEKKAYCEAELDTAEDELKELEHTIGGQALSSPCSSCTTTMN